MLLLNITVVIELGCALILLVSSRRIKGLRLLMFPAKR